MLKKEFCKKCWGEGWVDSDDEMWEQGRVHCRVIPWLDHPHLTKIVSTSIEPPKKCMMKLEYTVMEQKDVKERSM